jgi:hypothetical protein
MGTTLDLDRMMTTMSLDAVLRAVAAHETLATMTRQPEEKREQGTERPTARA